MLLKRRVRRKMIRREIREMDRKANQMVDLINAILEQEFQRTIPHFQPQDKLRVLVFNAWSYKYKVSIRFILESIVPYFLSIQKKHGRYRKHGNSLGVPISHLTGNRAREILEETIEETYRNNENVSIWKNETINGIIQRRNSDDESALKPKSIWDFDDPDKFFRYYSSYIEEERIFQNKLINAKQNQLRRYRGNPFIV